MHHEAKYSGYSFLPDGRYASGVWLCTEQEALSYVEMQKPYQHRIMEQVLGSAVFTLPHSPELEAQVLAGNLFADLSLKDSRGFRKEIQKISEEVFGV